MSTNIPFVDETWNPWQGCTKVSAGCQNCYMCREKNRFGQNPAEVVRSSDATFYKPFKYKKGTKCFTCSWSDFFIEQADKWRPAAWEIILSCTDVLFVIITKRADRISKCLPVNWGAGYPNVILGFTAEDQGWFDRRWSIVRKIPAAGYLCMHEPALGQIIYSNDFLTLGQRTWVIAGGETGPDARPAHADWFRKDRDQCAQFGTPFFFKSWGEWGWKEIQKDFIDRLLFRWPDNSLSSFEGAHRTGRLLDNKIHDTIPYYQLNQPSLFDQGNIL